MDGESALKILLPDMMASPDLVGQSWERTVDYGLFIKIQLTTRDCL